MSRVYSFVSGPKVGIQSAIRFLAAADLGHVQSDGSTEFDHDEARDLLNYTPKDTLQYVRRCLLLCNACSCSCSCLAACCIWLVGPDRVAGLM